MKKVLSIIVSLMLIVSPVYALDSEGVIYDNSASGSSATNVESALNDLYSKLNEKQTEINNIKNIGNATSDKILSGYTAYVKGNTITGSIPSKGATTYTPGTVNQTIASGQYLSGAQTIKGDANLVAANIAKGKSIFGISGTYTSDANAVAGNILSGKTAYVNGSKITGSMPSRSATTYTPGTSNQTIASGQYLSGAQTIKGDSNLVASNIAKGKTIFGISGTYTSDATATAADIKSGKTAYVNGSKITGTASGGDAKVYKFDKVQASIPSNVSLKYGTSVFLAKKGEENSYSIDLGFTPNEVISCNLSMTGNWVSTSDSKSSENFYIPRGYDSTGKTAIYYYVPYLPAADKEFLYFTSDSMSNYSGYSTQCQVTGNKLSFVVENYYYGTRGGVAIRTKADTLYLSGTLVYK